LKRMLCLLLSLFISQNAMCADIATTRSNMEKLESQGIKNSTNPQIKELYEQLNRTGVPLSQVLTRYKIKTISEMSPEVWLKAMNSLRMTASKVA